MPWSGAPSLLVSALDALNAATRDDPMSDVHAIHAAVLISRADTVYLLAMFETVTQVASRHAPVRIPYRLNVLLQDMAEAAACAGTCAQVRYEPKVSDFGPDVVGVKAAARRLNTTEANVRDLCARGTLAAMKPGGRWLISLASVDEHKAARGRKGA